MANDGAGDRTFDAAGRMYDLAVEDAERSHDAQAELVRGFEQAAAAIAAEVGEIVVEDDDDEHLVLTRDGHFLGKVLRTEPLEVWERLTTPDDVVDFYDPVDLFDDVANALAEAFPALQDDPEADRDIGRPVEATAAVSNDPWFARLGPSGDETRSVETPAPADDEPLETATMKVLRDLHAAGVYTDAEFAAKKAELDRT